MSVGGISHDLNFQSILLDKIQATNDAGGSRLDTRENKSHFFSRYAMNDVENAAEHTAYAAASPHDTVQLSEQALHYLEQKKREQT